jgi:hypothetical protein
LKAAPESDVPEEPAYLQDARDAEQNLLHLLHSEQLR